jgi:cell wall-associated NlpC family hydrolase
MSSLTTSTRCARLAIVLCTTAVLCTPLTAARAQAAPKPFEDFSNSARTLRDSVVQFARAQVGVRYKRGGTSPEKGFDCSGLIKYIMDAFHAEVPRTARQQAGAGLALSRDTSGLLPGDVLTFAKTKKSAVSHVGIYIGDGKYIHASTKAGRVIESKIDRPYSPLIKMWKGARRVLTLDDSSVVTASIVGKSGGGF